MFIFSEIKDITGFEFRATANFVESETNRNNVETDYFFGMLNQLMICYISIDRKLTLNFGPEWVHNRWYMPERPIPSFLQPLLQKMNVNCELSGNKPGIKLVTKDACQ